jgi:probable phosphoglycerate mutase
VTARSQSKTTIEGIELPDTPTRILLVRHGINDFVKQGRLAGRTPGVHLNEAGREQASALAERLADLPLVAVYSSPLERTLETAEPLAARRELTVRLLPGLLESDCGEWTGATIEELAKTDLWRQIQVCPSLARFPGGETIAGIQARMITALDELRAVHEGQIFAVVSHSDPIKLAVAHYIGLPLDLFQRVEIAPASITELAFTPLRPRLVRLNDCAHVPAASMRPDSGQTIDRDKQDE